MTFKKTLFMGLLGCTILAGCNGSNSVVSEPQVGGGTETATFDIANDTNGTTDPVTDQTGIDPDVTTTETTGDQGKGETGDGIDPLPLVQPDTFVPQELAQFVNTMRGANSSGDFSRGNTFPATAVPFGFNFWTPVNRDDNNWFYQFYSGEGGSGSVVKLYTISSSAGEAKDPKSWTLKASKDGTTWVTLDTRTDQTFQWRRQTRPFALKNSEVYSKYRLEFTGTGAVTLSEFELPAEPQTP